MPTRLEGKPKRLYRKRMWILLLMTIVIIGGMLAAIGYYLGKWYFLLTVLLLVILDEPIALLLFQKSSSRQALTGKKAMIDKLATVVTEFQEIRGSGELRGKVRFNGEIWSAEAKSEDCPKLCVGKEVRICSVNGLLLKVKCRDF
jgi:membrane protein implicated in regulation of membrane protease activity